MKHDEFRDFSDSEIQELGEKIIKLGDESGYDPLEFTLLLKLVCDELLEMQGIDIKEVQSLETNKRGH